MKGPHTHACSIHYIGYILVLINIALPTASASTVCSMYRCIGGIFVYYIPVCVELSCCQKYAPFLHVACSFTLTFSAKYFSRTQSFRVGPSLPPFPPHMTRTNMPKDD